MRRQILALTVLCGIFAAAVGCSGGVSDSAASNAPTSIAPAPTVAASAPTPIESTRGSVPAVEISADAVAKGQELFTGVAGCAACHKIDGLAHGVLGPELDGIGTLAETRIAGYTAEQYLRESIVDSCAFTVPDTDCNLMLSVMNTIVLSDADVDALVAFLLQQR